MRIEYKDLVIRTVTEQDVPVLCKWWNDGRVMAHAGFPNGLHTSVEEIVASTPSWSDESKRLRLLIEKNGTPIGEMNYRMTEKDIAEIGIKIAEESEQNKGQGKLLLSMLISELLGRGVRRIDLDTNLENKRAQHVYEQLGFVKTKIEYDSWVNQIGQKCSAVFYSLTKDTFRNYLND